MSVFRPTVINQIYTELDNTVFSKHLFELNQDGEDYLLNIVLTPKPEYHFTIREINPPLPNQQFLTIEAPGEIAINPQEYKFDNLNQVRGRISQWINRVQEDYRISAPEYNDLNQFREEILKQFEQYNNEGEEHFTEKEKGQLEEKLSQLEIRMEEIYEAKEASLQQINEMKKQIDSLKKGVEILDKRTWLNAAVNRVFDIYKEVKGAKDEVSKLFKDFNNLLPAPDESNEDDT